jgi:heme-degrading monooxygenase HmoA
MIARIWDAQTSGPDDTQRYQQVFDTEVLDHLSGMAGFRGAYLLARDAQADHDHDDHDVTAIRTITLFESLAAVRRFAGDEYQRERVTPQARATLLSSDPAIAHYEVLSLRRV